MKIWGMVGAISICLGGAARAAPVYDLQVLGALPGEDNSEAYKMNNLGQVVGTSWTGSGLRHVFLYDGTDMNDLLPEQASPVGINDSGDIALWISDACQQPVLITSDGQQVDLGTKACTGSPMRPVGLTSVSALNSARQVVGSADFADASSNVPIYRAALYQDGAVTDLGTLGGDWSLATAINEGGVIAGYSRPAGPWSVHPFVYANGRMKDLGTLGGDAAYASAINDSGVVAGASWLPGNNGAHAFIHDGVQMKDLGSLPGFVTSWAYGINASGSVVGYVAKETPMGSVFHGFLFDGTAMFDLNDLVLAEGWTIVDARAINDSGEIAAIVTGIEDGQFVTRAAVLTPQSP